MWNLSFSASFPRVMGDLIQHLILGFPVSSSVWTALLDHVIWDRQGGRIDFDSIVALNPYDTNDLHKCSTQCLLSSKIDNTSTVLLNPSRIFRSIQHYPGRGSFSSNPH